MVHGGSQVSLMEMEVIKEQERKVRMNPTVQN